MLETYQFNPYMVACGNVTKEMNPLPGKGFKKRTVMESISSFASYNIAFDTHYDPALTDYYKQGLFDPPTSELLDIMTAKKYEILSRIPQTMMVRDISCIKALFKEAFRLHLSRPDNYLFKGRRILFDIFDCILDQIDLEVTDNVYSENTLQKKLKNSQKWIKDNQESGITLTVAAERIGYSKEAFCRLYKKEFGQSPISFLIDQRLIRSKELLLTTDLTLDAITEMVGFNSTSHFCTTFKQRLGISPGRYRKDHRH